MNTTANLDARSNFAPGHMEAWLGANDRPDFAPFTALPRSSRSQVRFRPLLGRAGQSELTVLFNGASVALADSLAVLERFALKAIDHRPLPWSGGLSCQRFLVAHADRPVEEATLVARLEQALQDVWQGEADADAFSALVLLAGFDGREAALFRALARYLRQIAFPIGSDDIAAALLRNVDVTRRLLALFHECFDPARAGIEGTPCPLPGDALCGHLERIASAEDERVLRHYLMLLSAMLRTNYYRSGAASLAFKFASTAIEGLPLPRPCFEIFVHAPRVEGIHLRGGRVARGGIRWSDRPADFRSEVHGLLKAQMVKNVVIVPEGSKGGFVVRRAAEFAGNVAALREEAVACYRVFIRGLLDITDNIVDDRVVPPAGVVRRDDDDPYLVVAADKGTASFSDIANGIALEYGFWLGDAFASGGSVGYDHKKMGITARGAWESVRRHCRERGLDSQHDPITTVGVGDMSGDVFGNGMLLSPSIRLLGAFDHRHIFLDPAPLAADIGFAERQRLFGLSASCWADFRSEALGPGGGVHSRQARHIDIGETARQWLGLPASRCSPDEVVSALLRAEVDLLWLGGIGTYVKASDERDDQVGDRANDGVRVDAASLCCRSVGEGANLGFTQRGRIEYALAGGRINTDAIDNAGGVNCSDHEVNIKILLGRAQRGGRLDEARRNTLLRNMTGEVAALVLRDNYLQSLALSLAEACAPAQLDRHLRLIRRFERSGEIDRRVAGLPDDDTIALRRAAGRGLTRPELAVLLAYTKLSLRREILASDLPDDPLFERDLLAYFPTPLREGFADDIRAHPLRREIIATAVVNSMVNRVGSGFVDEMQGDAAYPDAEVARAYSVVRDLFDLCAFWRSLEALEAQLPAEAITGLYLASRGLTEAATLWVLRNGARPLDISGEVARLAPGVRTLLTQLPAWQPLADGGGVPMTDLVAQGVPTELAAFAAALPSLAHALEIAALAADTGQPPLQVAERYFALRRRFGLPVLTMGLAALPRRTTWEARAGQVLGARFDVLLRNSVQRALGGAQTALVGRSETLEMLLGELERGERADLAGLLVAAGEIERLI